MNNVHFPTTRFLKNIFHDSFYPLFLQNNTGVSNIFEKIGKNQKPKPWTKY